MRAREVDHAPAFSPYKLSTFNLTLLKDEEVSFARAIQAYDFERSYKEALDKRLKEIEQERRGRYARDDVEQIKAELDATYKQQCSNYYGSLFPEFEAVPFSPKLQLEAFALARREHLQASPELIEELLAHIPNYLNGLDIAKDMDKYLIPLLEAIGLDSKASDAQECCHSIQHSSFIDLETGKIYKKNRPFKTCKYRFCWKCALLRARRVSTEMSLSVKQMIKTLRKSVKDIVHLFITFTMPNPPIQSTNIATRLLNKGIHRVFEQCKTPRTKKVSLKKKPKPVNKKQKRAHKVKARVITGTRSVEDRIGSSCYGHVRFTEFRGSNTKAGESHPHAHMYAGFDARKYFTQDYIRTEEMGKAFRDALLKVTKYEVKLQERARQRAAQKARELERDMKTKGISPLLVSKLKKAQEEEARALANKEFCLEFIPRLEALESLVVDMRVIKPNDLRANTKNDEQAISYVVSQMVQYVFKYAGKGVDLSTMKPQDFKHLHEQTKGLRTIIRGGALLKAPPYEPPDLEALGFRLLSTEVWTWNESKGIYQRTSFEPAPELDHFFEGKNLRITSQDLAQAPPTQEVPDIF